jgi:hypothetical protein
MTSYGPVISGLIREGAPLFATATFMIALAGTIDVFFAKSRSAFHRFSAYLTRFWGEHSLRQLVTTWRTIGVFKHSLRYEGLSAVPTGSLNLSGIIRGQNAVVKDTICYVTFCDRLTVALSHPIVILEMFCIARKYIKIFKSVIAFYAVYVVHRFCGTKVSPYGSFYNDNVFRHHIRGSSTRVSGGIHKDVDIVGVLVSNLTSLFNSSVNLVSSICVSASITAKLFTLHNLRWACLELFSTMKAFYVYVEPVVLLPALARAIIDFTRNNLATLSLKGFSAVFANNIQFGCGINITFTRAVLTFSLFDAAGCFVESFSAVTADCFHISNLHPQYTTVVRGCHG